LALPVLVADPDRKWLGDAKIHLKESGYEVDAVDNGRDAQLALFRKRYFAIILNFDLKNHTGMQVLKFIKFNHPGLKVVLVLNSEEYLQEYFDYEDLQKLGAQEVLVRPFENHKLVDSLEGQQNFSQLIKNLKKRTGQSEESEEDVDEDEFTKVRIKEFFSAKHVIFDVYIKLREGKYLKILHAGDSFSKERIDKYINEKSIEFLYFKEHDRKKYIRFCNHLARKILGNKKADTKMKVAMVKNVAEKFVEEVFVEGIKPSILDQGKEICETVFKLVEGEKDLFKLLKEFQEFDPSAYSHAFLVSLFSAMIIRQFEWQSKLTTETVSLACLFHDIGKMKLPQEINEKRPEDMNAAELEQYQMHPEFGIELLHANRSIPPSVKQIIYQHHECTDGTGFPKGVKDNKIFTLSKIVHVADEFSHIMVVNDCAPPAALKIMLENEANIARYNGVVLEHFMKVFVDPKILQEIEEKKKKIC
jgi:putative nucleotidyltransferase with HDIG domain